MKIGLYRRVFNKSMKDAMRAKGILTSDFRSLGIPYGLNLHPQRISKICNFHCNPTEEERIAIAVILETPVETLFPEYYEEVYDMVSGIKKNAEIEGKFLSLNSPDMLNLPSPESADEESELTMRHEAIDVILAEVLNDRERKVIDLRYGLTTGGKMTLETVAKEMKVTRERIRQIEAKAMEKLRTSKHSGRLKAFLQKS